MANVNEVEDTVPWYERKPYGPHTGQSMFRASCHCEAVQYEVLTDPVSSKLCHCRDCQKLHGAPFEWVCIFHKESVCFTRGTPDMLYFWSSELGRGYDASEASERQLPVKVSCANCRTPIADEGRNMWLAYGTLFDFQNGNIPNSFKHDCHIFYGARCIDIPDDKPKWLGHKNNSQLL
mmetsp:Transcript_8441/g.10478  ORF Transcript_8441/g.10478 Transcript_8441/m.10478 type:complete len:178 (+) Transcript_8441:103-636(+)